MYVARYTFDPQYDAERRWTAWIGVSAKTAEGLADLLIDLGAVELPRRLRAAYDEGDVDEAIEWTLENVDIRYHEKAGLWMHVHNPDGLSCWPLEAETLEDAIAEAREAHEAGRIQWHGFGHVTCGNVRYVASVSDILHIFECDDVAPENDY